MGGMLKERTRSVDAVPVALQESDVKDLGDRAPVHIEVGTNKVGDPGGNGAKEAAEDAQVSSGVIVDTEVEGKQARMEATSDNSSNQVSYDVLEHVGRAVLIPRRCLVLGPK